MGACSAPWKFQRPQPISCYLRCCGGKRKLDQVSCSIPRVRAAHRGNFSGLNKLAVTCATAAEKNGPRDAATKNNEMLANTQAKKLRERAVDVVAGVHFSTARQPVAEKLRGRLHVLRIPEAPRACLAKNLPERVESLCISQQLCGRS